VLISECAGASEATKEANSASESQPKKRKKNAKSKICFEMSEIARHGRLQPQKMSKAKLDTLRANIQSNLIIESSSWHCESLLA